MKKTIIVLALAAVTPPSFAADKSGTTLSFGLTQYTQDLGSTLSMVDEDTTYHFKGDYTFSNGVLVGASFAPMHDFYAGSRIGNHSIYGGYQFDNNVRLMLGSSTLHLDLNTDFYNAKASVGGLMVGAGYVGAIRDVKLVIDASYSFLGSSDITRHYVDESRTTKSNDGMVQISAGIKF